MKSSWLNISLNDALRPIAILFYPDYHYSNPQKLLSTCTVKHKHT